MDYIEKAENIYQTKKFKLMFIKEIEAIFVKWIGFSTAKEVKRSIEKITELISLKKVKKAIFDNREAKVMDVNLMQWGIEESMKQYESGLRFSAIIPSEDIFNQYSMQAFRDEIKDVKNIASSEMFNTLDKAIERVKNIKI